MSLRTKGFRVAVLTVALLTFGACSDDDIDGGVATDAGPDGRDDSGDELPDAQDSSADVIRDTLSDAPDEDADATVDTLDVFAADDVMTDSADDARQDVPRDEPTPLQDNRDRLLDEMGRRDGGDRCSAWTALDPVQRGIFVTITDLLGNRSWLTNDPAGERTDADLVVALDHIVAVHAVRGTEEMCSLRCCGGGELHRIYLAADEVLIEAFRNDDHALPEWGPTNDLAGPHDPFTQSSETENGQPTGQAHFFAVDDDAVTLERPGVEGIFDPWMIEIDIDYNIFHESNPECDYLTLEGNMSGRQLYEQLWAPLGTGASVEFDYQPSSCP